MSSLPNLLCCTSFPFCKDILLAEEFPWEKPKFTTSELHVERFSSGPTLYTYSGSTIYKSPREGKYLEKTNSLEILAVHVLVLRVHWWNWLVLQCACWATSFWTSETTLLQVYLDKVTCETKKVFLGKQHNGKQSRIFQMTFFFHIC